MAAIQSYKKTGQRPLEQVYGQLVAGTALTSGTYDLPLNPGVWAVTFFISAATVSAGTLAVAPLAGDDATLLGSWSLAAPTGAVAATISLIGAATVVSPVPNTPNTVNTGNMYIQVYNKIRVTLAGVTGGNATNRIDFVATRIA